MPAQGLARGETDHRLSGSDTVFYRYWRARVAHSSHSLSISHGCDALTFVYTVSRKNYAKCKRSSRGPGAAGNRAAAPPARMVISVCPRESNRSSPIRFDRVWRASQSYTNRPRNSCVAGAQKTRSLSPGPEDIRHKKQGPIGSKGIVTEIAVSALAPKYQKPINKTNGNEPRVKTICSASSAADC